MIRKMIAIGLAVGAVFTLTAPITIMAQRPPYAFGGGEHAVLISDNAGAVSSERPAHISTTHQSYEYGTFLGVLTIERLGRSINVYGGATLESMESGAGHFSFTGMNHGNVGLIGHNRGSKGFFSFVRLLQEGDVIRLDMGGIVRTYEVFMTNIIDETDFTPLQQFGDNRLSLVTCLENMRNQRRVVSAREI